MPAPNISTSSSEVAVEVTSSPASAISLITPLAIVYARPTTTSGISASSGER